MTEGLSGMSSAEAWIVFSTSRYPATSASERLRGVVSVTSGYTGGRVKMAVGLAKGQVKAKGPVTTILKMVPLTKPLFPMYKEMCAEKDAALVA